MNRGLTRDTAGIARSWAAYAEQFLQHLGLVIPHWLVRADLLGISCSLLAALLVIACTLILLAGVHVRSMGLKCVLRAHS